MFWWKFNLKTQKKEHEQLLFYRFHWNRLVYGFPKKPGRVKLLINFSIHRIESKYHKDIKTDRMEHFKEQLLHLIFQQYLLLIWIVWSLIAGLNGQRIGGMASNNELFLRPFPRSTRLPISRIVGKLASGLSETSSYWLTKPREWLSMAVKCKRPEWLPKDSKSDKLDKFQWHS